MTKDWSDVVDGQRRGMSESVAGKIWARYDLKPHLMTKNLIYPGSFLLHDSLEVWLKNGT